MTQTASTLTHPRHLTQPQQGALSRLCLDELAGRPSRAGQIGSHWSQVTSGPDDDERTRLWDVRLVGWPELLVGGEDGEAPQAETATEVATGLLAELLAARGTAASAVLVRLPHASRGRAARLAQDAASAALDGVILRMSPTVLARGSQTTWITHAEAVVVISPAAQPGTFTAEQVVGPEAAPLREVLRAQELLEQEVDAIRARFHAELHAARHTHHARLRALLG